MSETPDPQTPPSPPQEEGSDEIDGAIAASSSHGAAFPVVAHEDVPGISAVEQSLDVSAELAALDIDRDYDRAVKQAVEESEEPPQAEETARAPSQPNLLGASLSRASLTARPVGSNRALSRPASAIDYEVEGAAHEALLEALATGASEQGPVGMDTHLSVLDEAMAAPCPVIVTGERGAGKSRLLAEFVRRRKAAMASDAVLFYHFVGCNGRSHAPASVLARLSKALSAALGISTRFDPPSEHDRLRDKAAELLLRARERGLNVTCVIDGLDRLECRPPFHSWLPAGALSSCRFVFSASPGSWKDVMERAGFRAKAREMFISPLSDRDAGTMALLTAKAASDATLSTAQLNYLAGRLRLPRKMQLAVRLVLPPKGAEASAARPSSVESVGTMDEVALYAANVDRSAAEHRRGLDSSVGAGEDPLTDALVMVAGSRMGLAAEEVRAALGVDRTVWGAVLSALLADGHVVSTTSGHLIARHRSLALEMVGLGAEDAAGAHLLAGTHGDDLKAALAGKPLRDRASAPLGKLAAYFLGLLGTGSDRDRRRVADELPWLLLRLGRTGELRTVLARKLVLERILATDRHSLRQLWRVTGASGDEMATLLKKGLSEDGGAGPDLLGRAAILVSDLGSAGSALPLAELSLKLVDDKVGRKHPAYADACNRLGLLQWASGRHAEASKWHGVALDILDSPGGMREESKSAVSVTSTTVPAGNPRAALFSTLRLLGAAQAAQGRHEDALHTTERALDVQEHLLGLDHVEVACTCEAIGHLQSHLGHTDDAITFYERALGIREAVLGSTHPTVVESCRLIAGARMRHHQFALAVPILERCLELLKQRLGPSHREVAVAHLHLGVAIARVSTVGDSHEDEHDGHKKGKGGAVARVASSIVVFGRRVSVVFTGNAVDKEGKQSEHSDNPVDIAFNFIKTALKSFEALDDPAGIAAACDNLAVLSGRVRDYATAVDYHRRALKCREGMLGSDHAEVATTLNDIGACLVMAGKPGEAIAAHQKAVELREKVLGKGHPATVTALANLAVAQEIAGRLDEAVQTLRRTLSAAEAARDAGPSRFAGKEGGGRRVTDDSLALAVADACSGLGVLLVRTAPKGSRVSSSVAEEALGLLKRTLETRERILGALEAKGNAFAVDGVPDDRVIRASTNLGRAYLAFGDAYAAADYFARSVRATERALADGHRADGSKVHESPELATLLSLLGSSQYQARDYEEARVNLERALEMRRRLLGDKHKDTLALRKYVSGRKFPAGSKRAA